MNSEILINTDRLPVRYNDKPCYDIVFRDSFDDLVSEIDSVVNLEGRKVCIVTETNVSQHYLDEVKGLLNGASCDFVGDFTFAAGEASKNLDVVRDLYEYLILNKFERRDILVALGGGVVGDLTGYAAATYLRGVDFIQVPTSLLSQVDSSIGGKTGVDFDSYKNMVGAFHMPKLVYINIATLKTLSRREYLSGMGEVVKYGIIRDKVFFDWIMEHADEIKALDTEIVKAMVYRSCDNKREVVEEDPKEQGVRALLNFGHTLGHAIEKLTNFKFLHGECVGVGSILAAEISKDLGDIDNDTVNAIKDSFSTFEFPDITEYDVDEVVKTTKSDKKMSKGQIKFVLIKSIGDAYLSLDVTDDNMSKVLKEYKDARG
ncbi:MAG: 3-dehydroquinate synthase [Lachnospiraceae bacterium]|nr:3-dehydroquinate synthase [Lachnospiraceae bacterium]